MRRVPRSVAGEGLRALMRARTRPGVTLGPHLLLTHPRAGGTQRGATSPFDGSPSHAPPASCSPSEMPGCPPAPTIPAGNPEGLSEVCTLWPCSRRSWGPLCSPWLLSGAHLWAAFSWAAPVPLPQLPQVVVLLLQALQCLGTGRQAGPAALPTAPLAPSGVYLCWLNVNTLQALLNECLCCWRCCAGPFGICPVCSCSSNRQWFTSLLLAVATARHDQVTGQNTKLPEKKWTSTFILKHYWKSPISPVTLIPRSSP